MPPRRMRFRSRDDPRSAAGGDGPAQRRRRGRHRLCTERYITKGRSLMNRYEGKTAVITGGTTGIGFSTAKLLVSEGAKVVITGRTAATVESAGNELGGTARGSAPETAKA